MHLPFFLLSGPPGRPSHTAEPAFLPTAHIIDFFAFVVCCNHNENEKLWKCQKESVPKVRATPQDEDERRGKAKSGGAL